MEFYSIFLVTNVTSGCNFINYVSKYLFFKFHTNGEKMKIQRIISVIAIAFALLFNQFGSASAKSNVTAGNGCQVNIVASTGSVPFETSIEVTGIEGPTIIIYGDSSDDGTGRLVDHTYYAVSRFTITAIVDGIDGFFYRCHGYVTTTAGENGMGLGGGMDLPKEEFEMPQGSVTIVDPYLYVDQISEDRNGMADNTGENSFSVVNTGEGNVDVTIEQAPVPVVPVIPNSCSGNCASNGGTIIINPPPAQNAAAVKTMPTTILGMFFYSIIDGITSPGESWKVWFVENN